MSAGWGGFRSCDFRNFDFRVQNDWKKRIESGKRSPFAKCLQIDYKESGVLMKKVKRI